MRSDLIWHEVEQNTADWFAVKNGKISGSTAAPLLSCPKKGKDGLSVGAWTLVDTIAGQLLAGEPETWDGDTHWTKRGKVMEPLAIRAYSDYRFCEVNNIGFVEWSNEMAGCSPDGGVVVSANKGLEVKCLSMPKHMRWLRLKSWKSDLRKIDAAHYKQVQWCLYATDFDSWDLVHFHPKAGKGSLDITTIKKDPAMQDRYAEAHEIAKVKILEIVELYSTAA